MANSSPTLTAAPHSAPPHAYDAGLLVLRLVLGLTIAAHGSQKLFGWFDGGGIDGTGQFFSSLGYPSGRTMAVIAGLSESLGGLGLVLGLLTPLAGAAVAGTMINVVWIEKGHGLVGGYEFPLLILAGAAALALAGPGRFAVDRMLPFLRAHRLLHGGAALALAAVFALSTLLLRN
ncbi:DoxX family protein [Wenjunlia tyrosinilytica]|uniref:DoxX family protein n=1 Tax=Wenjunlia tyrosinilytica TaxID=1544741 RepID=A0A917ZZV2_9ACTN|nr:DoxX family protein [Wenjunlia tyrosinilytica]GGP00534.1 hypothetical protein GCM10012280_69510 [Wenjunlia tyrosinilytica]